MSRRVRTKRPIAALRLFAGALGWSPLHAYQHEFPEGVEGARTIAWYESGLSDSGRADLFLQINEHSIGAVQTYEAAVYAPRFRLFTGWQKFRLTDDLQCDSSEADRLHSLLHRDWYVSLAARRKFRARHPECAGYSWKRIREVQSLR